MLRMIYNIIHTKTFQNEKKRVEGRMKKKKKGWYLLNKYSKWENHIHGFRYLVIWDFRVPADVLNLD